MLLSWPLTLSVQSCSSYSTSGKTRFVRAYVLFTIECWTCFFFLWKLEVIPDFFPTPFSPQRPLPLVSFSFSVEKFYRIRRFSLFIGSDFGTSVNGRKWSWTTNCQRTKAIWFSRDRQIRPSFGPPYWRKPMPSNINIIIIIIIIIVIFNVERCVLADERFASALADCEELALRTILSIFSLLTNWKMKFQAQKLGIRKKKIGFFASFWTSLRFLLRLLCSIHRKI